MALNESENTWVWTGLSWVQIDSLQHASFLQSDADLLYEVLGDIAVHAGLAGAHHLEDHVSRHSDGGADEVTVENLATEGGVGTVPVSDGVGGLSMTDIATQAELDTHEAEADPHTVYQKESEKGASNGYASLDSGGVLPDAQIPEAIARDSELHVQSHPLSSHSTRPHSALSDAPAAAHHAKYLDSEARIAVPYLATITFGWDPQSPQIFAP